MLWNRRRVFKSTHAKLIEQLEPRAYLAGVGQGLIGEYYADQSFTSLALARTDSTVNFTWAGSPGGALPADGYSVRWTGQVLAEFTQTHTFYASSAGGVRVWVNGVKVIDNWTTHGLQENQGTIALTAGQYYPIAVEYREEGTGSVKLSWSSASRPKQVIPQSQLYRVGASVISGGWLEGQVGAGGGSIAGSPNSGISISTDPATSPPTSPPPTSPPPPSGLNFNFQPASAPAVAGYLIDAGDTFGARNGQSYGWTSSNTANVVDRNINSNQLLDTNLAVDQGSRWELAVPNGSYTVTVGVGDAGAPSSNNVWIEGVNLYNYVSLGSNSFLTRSLTVNVADGRLLLGIGSAGSGLTKLNFIEVSGSGLAAGSTLSAASAEPLADSPAAGAIGGSSDSFHYLYRVARGNVELTARLDALGNGNEGGLIARGGLAGGGAFVGLTRDGSSVSLEYRTQAGATAKSGGSVTSSGAVFLRLVRDGDQYAGYLSPTGIDGAWQLVGTAGVDLGAFAHYGIGVSGEPGAASFSSVQVRPFNPLGGNVNSMTDRIQDLPFVDLVKTTRGFFNTAGRLDPSTGLTDFANTDANGWPTENFFFDVVDNREWNVPIDSGVYKMSFSGPSGVTVASVPGVTLTNQAFSGGIHTYDVNVPANLLKLGFTFTNTSGLVTNIRVLQPGYALETAPTFTAKYINLLKTTGPQVLRLMDWTKTNDNPVANWADRNTPSSATQSQSAGAGKLQPVKGIAWEYGIQLANQLGRSVWVNVPAQATDDYVRNLANLLRTQLNPDLNIWLEYTNEAWNTVFAQTNWIREQAVAEVFADKAANRPSQLNYDNLAVDTTKPGASNPNASTWGERWYARRTKQISDIFASAWTGASEANPTNLRVRTVLGAQIAAMSRTTNHLNFLSRFYPPPSSYLYAVGVAPYANVNGRPQSTKEEVIASLSASINAFGYNGVFAMVNPWGLKMVAYEIGFDTFGPENIAAKRAASLDPRMQEMLNRFMLNFYEDGGDLANWFTVGARSYNSPYGTWPLTEDLDILESAKIKGYQQVRDGFPVSTTAHGVFA